MSGGGGSNQDFELNITPIIDCFTVLITYLLLAASFISLGMFSITVASETPNVETPEDIKVVTTSLSLSLKENYFVHISLQANEGAEALDFDIEPLGNDINWEKTINQLKTLKNNYGLEHIMIEPVATVNYRSIIKLVSALKILFKNIVFKA